MNPMKEKKIGVSCLIVISVLFLVSCSPKLESTPTSTPTIQATITETHLPTNTKLPTSTITPTQTITPIPSSTPTLKPNPEPIEVIKVMQYNVLWGGRHTGRCAKKSGAYGDTFDLVLSIIRQADPDILIVNEACDWEKLAPQIMNSLGMSDYFVGIDYIDGLAPVAIFTKFEIVETESLKYDEEIRMETLFKGIRTRIMTSPGQAAPDRIWIQRIILIQFINRWCFPYYIFSMFSSGAF